MTTRAFVRSVREALSPAALSDFSDLLTKYISSSLSHGSFFRDVKRLFGKDAERLCELLEECVDDLTTSDFNDVKKSKNKELDGFDPCAVDLGEDGELEDGEEGEAEEEQNPKRKKPKTAGPDEEEEEGELTDDEEGMLREVVGGGAAAPEVSPVRKLSSGHGYEVHSIVDETEVSPPENAKGLYMNNIDPTLLAGTSRRTHPVCVVVENYHNTVSNTTLLHLFKDCGEIVTIQCVRDRNSGAYKGYSFVYFATQDGHNEALMSRKTLNGYRVMTTSAEEKKTLFVSNIHSDITQATVKEELLALLPDDMKNKVETVELKLGPPPARVSRGFAFVEMKDFDSAEQARNILYFCSLKDRPLSCVWADKNKSELQPKSATIFVNSLPKEVSEKELRDIFEPFGEVIKSVLVKNLSTGESKGYAFVEYKERDSALAAIEKMNGKDVMGQALYVDIAKPKRTHPRGGMDGGGGILRGGMSMMGMPRGSGGGLLGTPFMPARGDGAALAQMQTWSQPSRNNSPLINRHTGGGPGGSGYSPAQGRGLYRSQHHYGSGSDRSGYGGRH